MLRYLMLCLGLGLSACNTVASLHYTPGAMIPGAGAVAGVDAVDQRREAPQRLATIMGGYGNPLKTLDTAKPVKDEVADAFGQGLRVRGMLKPEQPGAPRLSLLVRKFDADMIIGRTARIDLTATLAAPGGAILFTAEDRDSESETRFFETGVMANIADLQAMSEKVLSRSVDRMLDRPDFRAAVLRAGQPGS